MQLHSYVENVSEEAGLGADSLLMEQSTQLLTLQANARTLKRLHLPALMPLTLPSSAQASTRAESMLSTYAVMTQHHVEQLGISLSQKVVLET